MGLSRCGGCFLDTLGQRRLKIEFFYGQKKPVFLMILWSPETRLNSDMLPVFKKEIYIKGGQQVFLPLKNKNKIKLSPNTKKIYVMIIVTND